MTGQAQKPPPVAIVVSRYNAQITDALLSGARDTYTQAGGDEASLAIIEAPGAFELPVLAAKAARSGLYRGIVALGCIIRGQTQHDRYIATAVASALSHISVETGVPVAFGVLTTNNVEQAKFRAGLGMRPKAFLTEAGEERYVQVGSNKGIEAMQAVLDTIAGIDAIDKAAQARTPGVSFHLSVQPDDKSQEEG
ncbi:MAG: 6,7-dimethyl-8-ribityllumazine synthase [Planctomycetota bacterium]|nr:MAG: 6,7-dimethyl-8-ribityllumazine synthase [Planctomycetota bacterium]